MRLLLTSDLHFVRPWFDWVAEQAPLYDLVCVSGDLLDAFLPGGLIKQEMVVHRWAGGFRSPLALSSGNHDANDPEIIPATRELPHIAPGERQLAESLIMHERWMDALSRPGVVTDNHSEVLETASGAIVVTTIPYDYTGSASRRDLWRTGRLLSEDTGAPWLVLHHEPPADTDVGGLHGHTGLPTMVARYRPDYVLSGHIHNRPYRGNFAARIGSTWCFNPGVPEAPEVIKAIVPNHIVLDTVAATAVWHATMPDMAGQQARRIFLRG